MFDTALLLQQCFLCFTRRRITMLN